MKIRLRYKKTEEGRFLSHLDLARTMERALRRAEIPLAFSEGFNPHPRISFASALAVGITGDSEYLDVELRQPMEVEEIKKRIKSAMPKALDLVDVREIPQRSKSLTALINLAEYSFTVKAKDSEPEKIQAGIDQVLAAKELWLEPRNKDGKKVKSAKEVRGLIRNIYLERVNDDTYMVKMALAMNNTGQLRPQEVWQMIAELGGFEPLPIQHVCRTGLYIEEGGRILLPMGGDKQDAQRNINEGGRR